MSEGYEAIFSAVSENIPLASTLSDTLLMCEHVKSAGRLLDTYMARRFLHSVCRQIQKSPSLSTKQRSSLVLVLVENNFGTFALVEPPNSYPHVLHVLRLEY